MHDAIVNKQVNNKINFFNDKCVGGKNKSKMFWNMLKGPRVTINPSQIIDPVSKTVMFEEKVEIETCLSEHFSKIGTDINIAPGRMEHMSTFVREMENDLSHGDNMFSMVFTKESITKALNNLKIGKAPGIDDIPNEFLKYGGDIMIKSLSDLFTCISDFEMIPDDWCKGIIKPLHKSGSIYDLDNYRGITLTSNVNKVFSKILETLILDFLESNNILGETQGAFRKDRRIEDQIFSLQGIASLYKSSRKPLYLAFLDLSKAFDRVWRDGLFALLWENGIKGKCWRLLRKMYEKVENKVIFGDFESDWFDQEFGLKQGCVLSPTLFSILMTDLANMLENSSIGANISSKLINCLLFADDVVLIAESPEELQELLNISNAFANKWNLKFNPKKSKILITSKKINKEGTWKLGNEPIEETGEYKYLGYFINRSLKSNFHVNSFLKEKADKQLNCLIRLLGEHSDFNRINFGESLWNSVMRPSLTHACPVWMPLSETCKQALESWQYRAAKIVIKTRMNIPKAALLLELGWEPILDFINRQKVSYYKRLLELPDNRLCKSVFNEMVRKGDSFWNYKEHVSSLINQPDVNFGINIKEFNKLYGSQARDKLLMEVSSKSSLDFYQQCFVSLGKQNYLNNHNDLYASRLKLLSRTKTIPLQKYLFRMHLSAHSKCLLCNNGEDEDLAHFLLNCPVLSSVRDEYFNIVSKQSSDYYIGVDFMEQSPSAKLQFIVGDIGYAFNNDIGIFYDFIGKMYIETCFRLRSEVLSVTV